MERGACALPPLPMLGGAVQRGEGSMFRVESSAWHGLGSQKEMVSGPLPYTSSTRNLG